LQTRCEAGLVYLPNVHVSNNAPIPELLFLTSAHCTELAVITGCSSGLGRKTAAALLRTGEYHVVGAVRDMDKMEAVAEIDEFPSENFTPMYCELNSFDSVKQFCKNLEEFKGPKPVDRLLCNAGVYQPSLDYAKWSADGHEQTMQINFLSHFLMIRYVQDKTPARYKTETVWIQRHIHIILTVIFSNRCNPLYYYAVC
jgi:NAD(P)-dependent dehydrogenase (short-subunit alcohol dehydrogenase family)